MSVVQKAVPIFFVLIVLEIVVSLVRGRKFYRLNDSVADLSTSSIFSIAGIGITVVWVILFDFVQQNWSIIALLNLTPLPAGSPLVKEAGGWSVQGGTLALWALVLVAVDFLYYWFHRATHQVNFLWACHVTHHSSEEFNLTVALRQCAFQRVFEYLFMLPLAFLGVSWFMMLVCHEIMKLFQFWVHTRYFKNLGWIEKIFLTPAHHRVHHGRDPEYLDKNHGGILILWDKWFGTFAQEKAEPHYGLTKPLDRWNPLWTNVHHYVYLWRNFKQIERWSDKFRFLIKPPGWKPPERRDGSNEFSRTPPVPADYKPYDPQLSRRANVYVFVQFLLLMGMTLTFLRFARSGNSTAVFLACFGVFIVLGFGAIGAVLDKHRLALRFESIRLLGAIPCFYLFINLAGGLPAYPGMIAAAISGVSFIWLWLIRADIGAGETAAAASSS